MRAHAPVASPHLPPLPTTPGGLQSLVQTTAPTLLDLRSVGVDTAAAVLTPAGDNPGSAPTAPFTAYEPL